MSTNIQFLRSSIEKKRPNPAEFLAGQPAVNYNEDEPGLYFADSTGAELFKAGPCHVGGNPPNENPQGFPGNTTGEQWLDTSIPGEPILKVWDGGQWQELNGIPKSIVEAEGGLIAGLSPGHLEILPLGNNGEVLTADSSSPLGVKWATPPSEPQYEVFTKSVNTSFIPVGSTFNFWLDLGKLSSILEVQINGISPETWVRIYSSKEGRAADTRVIPGPPLPDLNSGFITEVVTINDNPVVLSPCYDMYIPDGAFFKITNNSLQGQSFVVTVKYVNYIVSSCDTPPFSCNPYVTPYCVSDFSNAWANCVSFGDFPSIDVSSGENFSQAWQNCSQLTSIPLLPTGLGTDFSGAWQNCSQLTSFAPLDLGSGINFSNAWKNCNLLPSFPQVDISSGENFTSSWEGCASFNHFPNLDFLSAVNLSSAWKSCSGLLSFPDISFDFGENFSSTWQGCTSLKSFSTVNVGSGTNFTSTWQDCVNLKFFPELNISSGTNFTSTWKNCSNLSYFPDIDTSSGTNFTSAWQGCSLLSVFPELDVSSGTNFTSAWQGCYTLSTFPALITSSGTNFTSAWQGCYGLTSFHVIDTSSGTNFTNAWKDCFQGFEAGSCYSNFNFPFLIFDSGINFTGAWMNCTGLSFFPAMVFDNCTATNFYNAWYNCALNSTSVDNILVSLDTANQSGGIVNLDGGASAPPGAAGLAAKANLTGKGWTVTTN